MPLLTTLMETCTTLSQKVAELEKDKHSQALEILQLKKRVKRLERKKKSNTSRRMHPNMGKIAAINADEGIILVDEELDEEVAMDAEKYQNLKKKPVSIAQARKNMIIYLKNMAGYKMEFFKGMTYDKARPIFEREYKKERFKKLKAAEVLGSESTQEIPSNDPKEMTEEDVQNMLEIVPVLDFKVEALQVAVELWRSIFFVLSCLAPLLFTTRSKVNKSSEAHALISQALEDKSWVDPMQEELLQFQIKKEWILVDLPSGKKASGTKWVYKNKKDERGVKQKEDGIFISQDKYIVEILKKFYFLSVKTASTPIETQMPLVKDKEAFDVDVHLYRDAYEKKLIQVLKIHTDDNVANFLTKAFDYSLNVVGPKLQEVYLDLKSSYWNKGSLSVGLNTTQQMKLYGIQLTMLHSKELDSPKQMAL
nr:ribonuclease H-like domain, reverse transcriptase, RNA-dependent DNA polymerase [Tanacetum cinerariifolium]